VRVHIPKETDPTAYREDGYARYRQYAEKQAADYMSQHDWSLFEREFSRPGKVDFTYLLAQKPGLPQSLTA